MSQRLTVVFVLVQAGNKPYARMSYLAASAVRRLHPEARLVLVTDPGTTTAIITESAPKLLALMDQHLVEPADMPEPRARSFYLKTRVRDLLSGDLVYLDSDTLPIRPFADVFDRNWDIAVAQDRNHHCPIDPVGYPYWEEDRMKAVGWMGLPLTRYFNAGILFLRDNERVRAVVADWQKRWWQMYATGDDWDQLALNCSLVTLPIDVLELPAAYNAMIAVHPIHAKNAHIYHMFACNTSAWTQTVYQHLLDHLERTGDIDWPTLDRCVALGHPWLPPYWPKRLWQTGNRRLAVQTYLGKLVSKFSKPRTHESGRQS